MSKPISGGGALQNGDYGGDAMKQLGNLDRYQRRILSCSGGQEVSEISAICDRRCVVPVLGSSVQAFNRPTGFHVCNEQGSGICAPERYSAAHISGRLITSVAGSSKATAGYDLHSGCVCSPGPDCEPSEFEPDTESGVCILGNLLSDGVLHLSPIDRQMEATIDTLASRQECELSLCKAVDEACRHTDVDGLRCPWQTASETNTAQFS